jgi:hypothetical protein
MSALSTVTLRIQSVDRVVAFGCRASMADKDRVNQRRDGIGGSGQVSMTAATKG